MKRSLARAWAAALLAIAPAPFLAGSAEAQTAAPPRVDLELVLAVDASGSIDESRWDLERQGYAAAFRNSNIMLAIKSGTVGAIAVTLVEWSWLNEQAQVIPWTVISDPTSA